MSSCLWFACNVHFQSCGVSCVSTQHCTDDNLLSGWQKHCKNQTDLQLSKIPLLQSVSERQVCSVSRSQIKEYSCCFCILERCAVPALVALFTCCYHCCAQVKPKTSGISKCSHYCSTCCNAGHHLARPCHGYQAKPVLVIAATAVQQGIIFIYAACATRHMQCVLMS